VRCVNEILIVEDDDDIRNLIKIYLKELGVKLHFAESGEEGIKKYSELMGKGKQPDLVVMDLKLPGIDGVETTKRIMGIDSTAQIYGFTAFFATEWAEKLKDAGARGVIGRPVGMDAFKEKIKEILQVS